MTSIYYKKLIILILMIFTISISIPVYSDEGTDDKSVKPQDGEILLPDDYNKSDEKSDEKKCVTVCDQWGQDCIVNPKTGSRKCRRVCKSFTEECF